MPHLLIWAGLWSIATYEHCSFFCGSHNGEKKFDSCVPCHGGKHSRRVSSSSCHCSQSAGPGLRFM